MSVPKQRITKAKLKKVIADSIRHGEATLPAVASQLQLSPRSFQRQLALLNITYSDLVDDVRKEMAKSLLATTSRGIAEIGAVLGYRDPSSFSRAFMRWLNMSPRDYRASSRSRGASKALVLPSTHPVRRLSR